MTKILVTGASGFVGRALCPELSDRKYNVIGAFRSTDKFTGFKDSMECIAVGEIGPDTDWTHALSGVDVVIHLAARAHVLRENTAYSLSEFSKVNVAGTEKLAGDIVSNGVKRLIYISSIGVNGNNTSGSPFTEEMLPHPYDPYTKFKWEAEQLLHNIAQETGLNIVILRPPLIYGPNAPGNFGRLLTLVKSNIPLPFGSINNRRSFIYVRNLVDAIIKCIEHPNVANQTFLVSDGQDISTPGLIKMIAVAMGKKVNLIPFPPFFLKMFGSLAGKGSDVGRLTGSLQVDSSKIRRTLGWTPPFTIEKGISETVKWHLNSHN